MNVDALNSRYGAPGRIVFHEGFGGYPEVVIANKYGTAEIALLGGNVLSYRPTGFSQILFRPRKRDYRRGDAFHGGIPVCWPQFGNRFDKSLPGHGFAKLLVFEVRGTQYSEDMTEITLGVRSDADTRGLWPHDFDLELKVSVSMKLNLKLTTVNTGAETFAFSCGFHPYFLVRERNDAVVRGLDGKGCYNAMKDVEDFHSGELRIDHEVDHVFEVGNLPKHELALVDEGLNRAVAMVFSGGRKAVVWCAGPDSAIADFESGDWRSFVCVEPVSDWPGGRELKSGEKHELTVAIQAHAKMP
jgi:D-hexose-6-phosphate mutarotase